MEALQRGEKKIWKKVAGSKDRSVIEWEGLLKRGSPNPKINNLCKVF